MYKEKTMKIFWLLIILLLSACSFEENNIVVEEVIEEEILEENGIDKIMAKVSDISNVKSISIVKDDEIQVEQYFNRATETYLNNIFSVTKSVTSLLVGIAIEEGYIKSVDESITTYLTDFDLDESFDEIKIHHLLTMSSGIYLDANTSNEYHTIKGASEPLEIILDGKIKFKPGSQFQYSDATAYLMGAVLQEAIGMTLESYAEEKLFQPLGIENYEWKISKSQVTYPGFDLYLNCSAMQKIGLLVLHEGAYNGQQLVSQSWMTLSTNNHIKTYAGNFNGNYGYYWWLGDVGGSPIISALGHGGQFITIVPDLNLLITIATTGAVMDNVAGRQSGQLLDLIEEDIIPFYKGEFK